jgi:DNA helicase-2/ATP-dependent DNA helicase PcrA
METEHGTPILRSDLMDQTLLQEKEYLERTKCIAREQICWLKENSEKVKADIIIQKQEMREEAKHSISSNLNSSDNFEQLVALSQLATQASDMVSKYEDNMKKIDKLEKFMHRPYFARIDFTFDDDKSEEKIYIGRYPITKEPNFERLVYDWRAPISSLFYRYGTGRASYEAPVGQLSGEINLKRQYEINSGELQFYFDADMQILDDFLRKMLTHNASHQMKSIVETIQRDQDLIIRNMASDLMMVQGVAGSGKTSVALHRVAYLMYQGLSNHLGSQNIIILSPNALFEKYISQVLPELGEENVASFLFDDLYDMILEKPFQSKNQLYESILSKAEHDHPTLLKDSLSYKMRADFVAELDKLNLQANMSVEKLITRYKQIFSEKAHFKPFIKESHDPLLMEAIRTYTNDNLNSKKLRYEDASALVYLYLKSNGYNDYRHIKHVVVDEAQDYYPIHFEIVKLMFPSAQFTILGDINQTIEKHEKLTFYDAIKDILSRSKATLVSMDKSFRCAHEILEFSTRFVDTKIQSYSRHCEVPQIMRREHASDFDGLLSEIKICRDNGFSSIGILCKTERASQKLYEKLHSIVDVHLIQSQTSSELTGTFVLPIYLSKGLEFDAAIIWDVDDVNYNTLEDKQLLYIASTRALHRLNLFYLGKVSPLCLEG